jgi:hypothetical protein
MTHRGLSTRERVGTSSESRLRGPETPIGRYTNHFFSSGFVSVSSKRCVVRPAPWRRLQHFTGAFTS